MADWEERFDDYVERLGDVLGHADRRAPLRAYAGLERDCVVVGANTRLEIWDAAAWAAYEASHDPDFAEEDVPG